MTATIVCLVDRTANEIINIDDIDDSWTEPQSIKFVTNIIQTYILH